MPEKKKKILKISMIAIFAALFVTAIVLSGVLIAKKKEVDRINKENQEIVERLGKHEMTSYISDHYSETISYFSDCVYTGYGLVIIKYDENIIDEIIMFLISTFIIGKKFSIFICGSSVKKSNKKFNIQ